VFEDLKREADQCLTISVKKSTKKGYDGAWKRWCAFVDENYSTVTEYEMSNLTIAQKVNLMIKFISNIYDHG
jgi:hypothetical protein